MMLSFRHKILFLSLVLAPALSIPARAHYSKKAKATEKGAGNDPVLLPRKKADTGKAAEDYRRVPQYFGQVNLSEEQRESIYSIREKYAKRQAQLEEELATIRDSVLRESEAVLNKEQRDRLIQLRGQAKAKASAKAKAKTKS